jgi:ATP-dependent DNA helicase DinG
LSAISSASWGSAKGSSAAGAAKSAQAALEQLAGVCSRLAAASAEGLSQQEVVWCSRMGRDGEWGGGEPVLNVAPLDVAAALRDGLVDRCAVIATSATLTVGGRFEPAAARLGLDAAGRGADWTGEDVGSPFDYAHGAILYVAADLPAPRGSAPPGAEQHQAIAELIQAAGGGALALFTSRAAAQSAAEAVAKLVDVPILCQGETTLSALVARFVEEEPTCLFGTLSLWQGIDAPGPTCRLVTIDRIPFPRPDDPLVSARSEARARAGGNGFMEVSAAHAALMLAQGAGRLIRRADDKGVVAVLDPRLATARYGPFLLASLPPMWRTNNRQVAVDALKRLRGGA